MLWSLPYALELAIRSGSWKVVFAFIKRVREADITACARKLATEVGVRLDEQSLSAYIDSDPTGGINVGSYVLYKFADTRSGTEFLAYGRALRLPDNDTEGRPVRISAV
jgi:hypothetical protein